MTEDHSNRLSPQHALWDADASYHRVALRDITIEMSVGIADWERTPGFKQRVIINVELFTHSDGHRGGGISSCINYDPIHEYIVSNWPDRPHTDLLETLAEELIPICFNDARVEACRISLQKPDVYQDTGAAMVEFYRLRRDLDV